MCVTNPFSPRASPLSLSHSVLHTLRLLQVLSYKSRKNVRKSHPQPLLQKNLSVFAVAALLILAASASDAFKFKTEVPEVEEKETLTQENKDDSAVDFGGEEVIEDPTEDIPRDPRKVGEAGESGSGEMETSSSLLERESAPWEPLGRN